MNAERIAELRVWSEGGCANSSVIIELLDELARLQGIVDKLRADNKYLTARVNHLAATAAGRDDE